MEDPGTKAAIFYNYREKYFNTMLTLCKNAINNHKNDTSYLLYHALALLLNNRVEECINELETVQNENELKLSATIALIYAHKLLGASNKDLLAQLEAQTREYRKTADASDFYHSAFVLNVFEKPEKALDYIEKSENNPGALALKAWILLALKNEARKTNIIELFEESLKHSRNKNLDAFLGLSEAFLAQKNKTEALNTINKAIIRFPDSILPLVYKIRAEFSAQDWDQVIEMINRVLTSNPDNLEAIKTNIVLHLVKEIKIPEAGTLLIKYLNIMDANEPKNYRLLLENAALFSCLTSNAAILSHTHKMAAKALQINAEQLDCIISLANQCFLLNSIQEAEKYYKTATRIDENSFEVLLGLVQCEIAQYGGSVKAKKQVEYLLERKEAQTSAKLYAIRGKLAENGDDAVMYLKMALDAQMAALKGPNSTHYLSKLQPVFILEVVKEFLANMSSQVHHQNGVETVKTVLKQLTIACPGFYEAFYCLARLQFVLGDAKSALLNLDQILNQNSDDVIASDVYLLMAQVQVHCGHYERAGQTLESCLSHDFRVRDNPRYFFIRGLVEKHAGHLPDAIKSLTNALRLSEAGRMDAGAKADIFIALIEAHNGVGQVDEAGRLVDVAMEEFRGTREEARMLILCAESALERRNVQGAIDLLGKVDSKEVYYLEARRKMADVMLKYHHDRYAYLQCYQDMVAEDPKPESYLLLGDAYMTVLEPDDALACYEMALAQSPQDELLSLKLGNALVETHYFTRAINFYKDAIRQTDNSNLKLQLADLYMQLKQYDKAQLLLAAEIETEKRKHLDDLTYLQYKTKLLNLLAQTQEKAGNLTGALTTLKEARDNQNRVRKRFMVEQTNVPEEEIKQLVDIGVKLAEISTVLKRNDDAIQFYKEALEGSPNHVYVLVALAKLYMQMNSLDPCQQICANILRIDADNETASVMMADIAFRKIDFDMALFHFTQLLTKQPTNWQALSRLVEILRRTGCLHEVSEYLANAEGTKEAGFLYCTALYQMFSGNLNAALRNFNAARGDPDWGLASLYNMIEICLNPDDELLGEQFMEEDTEYRDSRTMALKTADRLLNELKHRLEASGADLIRYKLLTSFRLLSSQEKPKVERGLEDFIALASLAAYKEHVGPILGMATAYTMLKQTQRAKNQLKRVAKTAWTFEDAEYLERCWLLLADYYIQSGKLDVATELLNKIVGHNRACNKAYEYLGFVCEKEQRYRDAVGSYELAWKYGGRTNLGVGYKLGYNLVKCKSYAEAIDVGQQVLKLNPDYPKVRKDVLDKAMNNLRI